MVYISVSCYTQRITLYFEYHCTQNMSSICTVLLYVHLKNGAFPISFPCIVRQLQNQLQNQLLLPHVIIYQVEELFSQQKSAQHPNAFQNIQQEYA